MKQVAMIRTKDGILHATYAEARRHAERVYGEALTRLAAQAVRQEKYTAMCQFIEDSLGAFVELNVLRSDIALEDSEDI